MLDKLVYANKDWGRTAVINEYSGVSIYQAFVVNGQSSIHKHERDVNIIVSIDATIMILFFDNGPNKLSSSFILLSCLRSVILPAPCSRHA